MRRRKFIYLIILVFVFLTACKREERQEIFLDETEEITVEETEEAGCIFVYVCGAVKCEGVYELPAGCRVYEAIAKAGGFREDAAANTINQAELLKDASRLYVPTLAEVENLQSKEEGKVNINSASKEELMSLPGVGASRADSIIQYREKQGAFQTIEDIMQISGIKEGLFEKIKELITI